MSHSPLLAIEQILRTAYCFATLRVRFNAKYLVNPEGTILDSLAVPALEDSVLASFATTAAIVA